STSDTNAPLASTMYVLVAAPSRLPSPLPTTRSATLIAPISPAIGCDQPPRSEPGAMINSAAHGSPTRLGGAHSRNSSSATNTRPHAGPARPGAGAGAGAGAGTGGVDDMGVPMRCAL